MPLSWNEIKDRALKFTREWADESSEDAEAKSFWDAFFNVFGVSRRRVATFEQPVKKSDGHDGYIDLLWRGIILVEHKSRGKDLNRAFQQAKNYFPGLKDIDLPRYILVSDFARFRLYDLEESTEQEFTIKDFYKNVKLFGFIAGYQTTSYKEQDPANVKAAERMGKLHDKLKIIGYEGHDLEVYLVRLLFCLFAEDTSIFERRLFQDLIEQRTAQDGSDLAMRLEQLFQVLDTPSEKRLKNLDEQLAAFPYVNGSLFKERLPMASFDTEMRDNLLLCCALDWSRISPAIFGALFQSVMDQKLRRNLGAHYTSEKNILKLIRPLFLDELRAEFERIKLKPKPLYEFHQRLAQLKFLDPACGCGNFLVIAYRELRLLELEVIRALYGKAVIASLDVAELNILCDVDQFYGIEIEEFPAQIAQTALWLMDHQMNMRVSEEFGSYFVRLPLKKSAKIVHGNALRLDWREVVKPEALSYILGNPPFLGKNFRNANQSADMDSVFKGCNNYKSLDFVSCWFYKAAEFMAKNPQLRNTIKTAFVSTNSITMGEQVAPLWQPLLSMGADILFAHRTFAWESEAKGKAAVHVVIIVFEVTESIPPVVRHAQDERNKNLGGIQQVHYFAESHNTVRPGNVTENQNNVRPELVEERTSKSQNKRLYFYSHIKSEPEEKIVSQISPYLIDAPPVILNLRNKPLCTVPPMKKGNQPTDGGNLLLTPEEKDELLRREPQAERWIRPLLGAEEFINGLERWCLWLVGIKPHELKAMPEVMKRVAAVKEMGLQSSDLGTREMANLPTQFRECHEYNSYILIPSVSSERREYIPMGLFDGHTISTNLNLIIPNSSLYEFGILESKMHMAWMRTVAGRLESRYRYSAKLVYNNFPWPQAISEKQHQTIETAAQAVLDARAKFPESSLADLYDPLTMPPELVKAHHKLDAAVDAAYTKKKFSGDSDRVAFLFELYQQLTRRLN